MLPRMTAFITAFLLVCVAEMADKTQLLTLCLTCRYPVRKVLLGITLAISLLNLGAVAIGGLVGEFLPVTPVKIGAGLLFIGFGIWTLVSTNGADEEESCETSPSRGAVTAVFLAFLVAELGDKTQLATISLSARFSGFGGAATVWLGATLGMLAANSLAIGGGTLLGNRLSERTLKRASAVLFIAFGLWTLADALNIP